MRKRIIRRALVGLVSILIGGAVAAVGSTEFREFVGDSDLGLLLYLAVPSAVLAVDKWWRARKA